MSKTAKIWLGIVGVVSFAAFVLGLLNAVNGDLISITWYFSPLGIFISEDALILGLFLFLGCVWLWRKNNPVWIGLFFSAYAAIRSLIEALYAMQAQFSPTIRPWEIAWRALPIVQRIGIDEVYVIYQLLYTIIFVISMLLLLVYARRFFRQT